MALRTQADVLDALAATLTSQGGDELLDVAACSKRYGVGRDALRGAADRSELAISKGARGKWLVKRSALEMWIESRPYKPAPRAANERAPDLDAWERSVRKAG
jgi:hypothetical protein